MKKYITIILLSAFCMAACKKDKAPVQNVQGKQDVTIKVGFSKIVEPYTTGKISTNAIATTAADTAITNHANKIFYVIFDANNKKIQAVTQITSSGDFGTYSAKLDPGTYTVVVAAGSRVYINGLDDLTYASFDAEQMSGGGGQYSIGEFYYKKSTITVGNSAVSANMDLDRVSSMIRVKLTDIVPQNVSEFYLFIDKIADSFKIATSAGTAPNPDQYFVTSFDRNNLTIYYPLLIASPTVNITLTAWDVNSKTVASKSISNVPVAANTITTLTGSMFGGSPSDHGMKVTLDSTWTNVYKPF